MIPNNFPLNPLCLYSIFELRKKMLRKMEFTKKKTSWSEVSVLKLTSLHLFPKIVHLNADHSIVAYREASRRLLLFQTFVRTETIKNRELLHNWNAHKLQRVGQFLPPKFRLRCCASLGIELGQNQRRHTSILASEQIRDDSFCFLCFLWILRISPFSHIYYNRNLTPLQLHLAYRWD